jgi:hypothetical protein
MSNYTDHSINSILNDSWMKIDDNSYDSDDSSRHFSGRFAQYYEFHGDADYENGKAMQGMNLFMTRFIKENIDIIQELCTKHNL